MHETDIILGVTLLDLLALSVWVKVLANLTGRSMVRIISTDDVPGMAVVVATRLRRVLTSVPWNGLEIFAFNVMLIPGCGKLK